MERTAIELRAQNAGYVRHMEELQNRIFILEDRLDDQRFADERAETARPPSKRIGAPMREAALVVEEPPGEVDDGVGVDYAGEAALPSQRDKSRPMLRLVGNGAAQVTTVAVAPARDPKDPTASPQDSAAPTEKISVRKSASSPAASASSTTSTAVTAAGEPLRLYRQALNLLKAGHPASALGGFRRFLARYPRHDYDDNAQYLIGECYYDLKQYRSAIREFRHVVERYPRANKVPDAMLKMGFAHLAMGDRRDGRQDLESLRRLYPDHAATRLATARLGQPDRRTPPSAVTLEMTGR